MDILLQLHGFPERHQHNCTNSCLQRTTTIRRSRPSARFFSVARERKRSSEKLLSDDDYDDDADGNDDDDDDDDDDGGEGKESNESTPHPAFNFVLWHRIFTFIDFILLLKRVSSTYHVYKKFFLKPKAAKFRTFGHRHSTSERSDHQVEALPSGREPDTCSVYNGENIIRANSIGIFEEWVRVIFRTVLLIYVDLLTY